MPSRHALCEELLGLKALMRQVLGKDVDAFAREKEIKTILLSDADGNFKEVVDGIGVVKVSAPKPERCTGTAPEIVVEAFLGMTELQRDRLTEKGIVKIAEQWTGKYYGSVTVELF
jgi:hypothetical protein